MKIVSLNGFARVDVDNVPSLINEDSYNGFSRVNPQTMHGFSLNGYTLNGYELNGLAELDDTEFEMLIEAIDDGDSVNGIFKRLINRRRKKRASGQTAGQRRRSKKDTRRLNREEKKRLKRDRLKARTERIRSRKDKPGFMESIKGVAEKLIGGEGAPEFLSDIAEDIGFDLPGQDEEFMSGSAEQRGLFDKRPFYKKPFRKWSTMQKVGVIGGGLVAVDLITGGKIRQAVGIGKPKKTRR